MAFWITIISTIFFNTILVTQPSFIAPYGSNVSVVSQEQQLTEIKDLLEEKKWTDTWLPFFAALLVGLIAYWGVLKQAKATSISGFRVNWIEDLRISYSELIVSLNNVGGKIRAGTLVLTEYRQDTDAEKSQFLISKIKLLLNHNNVSDPEHLEFWKKLVSYIQANQRYYSGPYSEPEENDLDAQRVEMEEILLVIFKKEWEKAKKFN